MKFREYLVASRRQTAFCETLRLPGVVLELHSSDASLLTHLVPFFSVCEVWLNDTAHCKVLCQVEFADESLAWRTWLPLGYKRNVDKLDQMSCLFYACDEFEAVEQEAIGVVFFPAEGHILCLVCPPEQEGEQQSEQVKQTPLFICELIMGYALSKCGKFMVHAGVAGRSGNCVLWTGPGGAGKSTMVFRMVQEGWDYFGDDLAIVGRDGQGHWRVWPWWRPAYVSRHTCRLVPLLAPLLPKTPDTGKHIVEIDHIISGGPPSSGYLRKINVILPPGAPAMDRMDFAQAFDLLGPNLLHSFGHQQSAALLENTFDLIHEVPVSAVPRDRLRAWLAEQDKA